MILGQEGEGWAWQMGQVGYILWGKKKLKDAQLAGLPLVFLIYLVGPAHTRSVQHDSKENENGSSYQGEVIS